MASILVVDHDSMTLDVLGFIFNREGFDVVSASDGASALEHVGKLQPSLGILGVNLGESSGFDLLERIRTISRMPLILLSARAAEEDKVRGLLLGADDYLTKPFGHQELLARVHAHLRRASRAIPSVQGPEIRVGSLVLDRREHSVHLERAAIKLSPTEFRLLDFLMQQAGRVVSISNLADEIWGSPNRRTQETARVALHRLRRKLHVHGNSDAQLIQSVRGLGVLLSIPKAVGGGEHRVPHSNHVRRELAS